MTPRHLPLLVLTCALAGALSSIGCTEDDPHAPRECEEAAESFVDVLVAAEPRAKQLDRAEFHGLEDALASSCREGGWSRAARACIRAADDETALRACDRHWTSHQRGELLAELEAMSDELDREKVSRIGRRMDKIRDRICQCTDAACADRELATLEAYTRSLKFWTPDIDRDEYAARMTGYRDEIAACARAARGS